MVAALFLAAMGAAGLVSLALFLPVRRPRHVAGVWPAVRRRPVRSDACSLRTSRPGACATT